MPRAVHKSGSLVRPLLFFDSGIGGLTVLREARLLMPAYPFVYAADNAAFPYGDWEEEALRAHLLHIFAGFLRRYNPVLCVLACNTASTLALDDLRRAFPDYDFVGTVPAIKPAAEHSASGQISVLATPGTVKRAYTQDLIAKYAGQSRVTLVGSTNLAAQAEAYVRGLPVDTAAIRAEIAPCFVEEKRRRTDIIVLACTHYPFLTPLLRNLAPWPVDWLDPAAAIARRAQSLLQLRYGAPPAPAGRGKNYEDYAFFTDNKAGADFISARLFHGFGLKIQKNPDV